jgi:inorganic triphosphatase YgiF
MANEIELKLRIAKSDIPSLKRQLANIATTSLGVQLSKPSVRKTLSVYYDTPDLTLLDRGISLRIRRAARKWMQTIKGAGNALSGLHQRLELESEIKSGALDFSQITDPTYAAFFEQPALRNALSPIFSTDVQRTTWQLTFDHGDQVELVLDVGELIAGEHREPICELELELIQGHPGRLFAFALQLQAHIPLSIENISKAQRAYAYYRTQPLKIVKAKPVKLKRKMLANDALKQIAESCLTQLQGNQDMVLHGTDVEGVHQMRIALRRLRSALKVFGGITQKQTTEDITQELVWMTNVLGDARDLDVFITQTLPPMLQQMQNQSSLVSLAKKAKQDRQQAYKVAREAITSQRYQRLLLTLGDWLENQRWRKQKTAETTVDTIASTMLTKRYKGLKQSGKTLKHAEPEERHETRIAAKKLRYLAEFFSELYPSKNTKPFIKSLSLLQDQLGVMNDISVTSGLMLKVMGEKPPRQLMTAKHLIDGWNAHRLLPCTSDMDAAWESFSQQKPFW